MRVMKKKKKLRKHGYNQQFVNYLKDHAHLKIKELIMRNLLFTFPKHITYIYRTSIYRVSYI